MGTRLAKTHATSAIFSHRLTDVGVNPCDSHKLMDVGVNLCHKVN